MSVIISEQSGGVLRLTLNRPDKMNAFNRAMALELQALLDAGARSGSVRVVVITGSGKAFSAGQDLPEAVDPKGPGLANILREQFNPIIERIRALEKPVVAAVNGVAAGAGANIALCCDIVVAAASASFVQAFSRIGLIPDSGGTFFLPRLVGWQKASALMMLGERISAAEAERMGMIYKSFEDERFAVECEHIVSQLSQLPTKALALTKAALNRSMSNSLEQQLQVEDELQLQAGRTDNFREGVQAFLEKRSPQFTGK